MKFILKNIQNIITVKAFVVTPKITKNSIILRGGYDKGYKFFYSQWKFICLYPNLFVCILINFNKNIHFHWIKKKMQEL